MKTLARLVFACVALAAACSWNSAQAGGCHGGPYCPQPTVTITYAELYRAWVVLCQNPHLCQQYPQVAALVQQKVGPIPGAPAPAAVPAVAPNAAAAPVAPSAKPAISILPPTGGVPAAPNAAPNAAPAAPNAAPVATPAAPLTVNAPPTPVSPVIAAPQAATTPTPAIREAAPDGDDLPDDLPAREPNSL